MPLSYGQLKLAETRMTVKRKLSLLSPAASLSHPSLTPAPLSTDACCSHASEASQKTRSMLLLTISASLALSQS